MSCALGRRGIRIEKVVPASIASELGIEAGDKLLAVNRRPVKDILEYQYYTSEEVVVLDIEKADGEVWSIEIEKEYDEDLGLVFSGAVFDRLRTCRNRCLFCFMDQLPSGVRKSLRTKDDDYRLSFLYGNFITLTNLDREDWEAIAALRLSPLYVSVHATDSRVRAFMLGNEKGGQIISDLNRLRDLGLQVHTQVVLCPGINDGEVLAETVSTLASFWPTVLSIGIVPVGLTRYREGLYPLQAVDKVKAQDVITRGQAWQRQFRAELGLGLVYLADEFFIKAEQDFPPNEYYDGYPQIENGIGMAREFLDRLTELDNDLPRELPERTRLTLVCGHGARLVLERAARRLNRIKGLEVAVMPVSNRFFGEEVTVTGLLTGQDIERALADSSDEKGIILIPDVVLREDHDYFLDDMTVGELMERSGKAIDVVEATADGLVNYVRRMACEGGGVQWPGR